MTEWEADVRIRRNGRLVNQERIQAESAKFALYWATNDLELWCDEQDRAEADRG